MRSPRVLVVDLGASGVACGVFTVGAAGRLVLQQFAEEAIDAEAGSEEQWLAEVSRAFGAVARRHRFRGAAEVAIPGRLALTKFVQTPSMAKEKRDTVVAFEAAQNIPYPLEHVVWDHVVLGDDGLDLELMLVAVKADAMRAICGAAEAAGLSIERATPAGIALRHAFRYNYPQVREPVMVVDVGARTTTALFLAAAPEMDDVYRIAGRTGRDNATLPPERFYLRTLAMGGNHVTHAIAEDLRIEFAAAERLKLQVLSGGAESSVDERMRNAVRRASADFAARLSLELTRSMLNWRRQTGAPSPLAIYLAGGGSVLRELPEALREKLGLPVERFEPLRAVDLSGDARASGAEGRAARLAGVVGLAARLVMKRTAEPSLLPTTLNAALSFKKRQPRLLAAVALIAFSLLPPLGYLHRVEAAAKERERVLEAQLEPWRELARRNEQYLRRIQEVTTRVAALRGAYEARTGWLRFLSDLQQRLTTIEDAWLDRLQVQRAEPSQAASAEADTGDAAAPNVPPVRLVLSGQLLDSANPQAKVSAASRERAERLLASFAESEFVATVENERFDTSRHGLLRFDVTLVLKPGKLL